MSEFPNRATLEAAIVRVAFYYCQLESLARIVRTSTMDGSPMTDEQRQDAEQQYERAKRSSFHLYAELERLTELLSESPPDAPRNGPPTGSSAPF